MSFPKIITTVLFFGCFTLLAVGVSGRRFSLFSTSTQPPQTRAINKTTSVRISNIRQLDNGDVEVTFINQSTKAIYAYTMVTTERPMRKGVTTFATSAPVGPGESRSERIPGNNFRSNSAHTSPDGGREVVFSALYLEGGESEGDERDSGKLIRTMTGMKEQAVLALQVLRAGVACREQDPGRLLEAVASQAVSMPVKGGFGPMSKEREDGKAMVNDRLLKSIQKLRSITTSPGFDAKSTLAELIGYYERLAQKL